MSAPKWRLNKGKLEELTEALRAARDVGICPQGAAEIAELVWSQSPGPKLALANAELRGIASELHEALSALLKHYVTLIQSGDCGFWDPEKEDQVRAARAALAKARGEEVAS